MSKGNLGRWYTPVEPGTLNERESTSYGTLATADEVKSVVLPKNGLLVIGYAAKWKSSVSGAGSAAIFLGANQLKNATLGATQECSTSGTEYNILSSTSFGLNSAGGPNAFVSTGTALSPGAAIGGPVYVFAEAGTYNVSIQFKASSGTVSAKERRLWVGVIGV